MSEVDKSGVHPSSTERTFRVSAVIKYTREVGLFQAASKEEAGHLACRSHTYARLADRSPGGIYDLEIEEVDETPSHVERAIASEGGQGG